MNSSEKFTFQWDKFQDNAKVTFHDVRKTEDFSDVTLVCEDGQQIQAHRVILSSSSLFFRKLLQKTPHNHPMVYMRGVHYTHLATIVDFIYHGEVEVVKNDLETFLEIAEELSLISLKEMTNPVIKKIFHRNDELSSKVSVRDLIESVVKDPQNANDCMGDLNKSIGDNFPKEDMDFDLDLDLDLDLKQNQNQEEEIDSMMETSKLEGGWVCLQCGQSDKTRFQLRRHVEKHIAGYIHYCPDCTKTFTTRNDRKRHVLRYHPQRRSLKYVGN